MVIILHLQHLAKLTFDKGVHAFFVKVQDSTNFIDGVKMELITERTNYLTSHKPNLPLVLSPKSR